MTNALITVTIGSGEATIITALSATDQQPGGGVDITYTVSEAATVDAVLTTSATAPTATQIGNGQDHTGAIASDSWTGLSWTTGGADAVPSITSGLAAGTYYLHAVPQGSGNSEVASTGGFTLDTAPPVVSSIVTNTAGDVITINLDKDAYGELSTGVWTLNGASGTQTFASADSLTGDVVLQLSGNPVLGSDELTLEYNNGAVTDYWGNSLANFTGLDAISVQNNVPATYSETLVTVPLLSALRAPAALASGTTSLLFFFSGVTSASGSGRKVFANWDGSAQGVYATFNTSSGNGGLWVDMDADGLTATGIMDTVPHGTRYHALMHIRVKSDGDLELIGSVRTSGGSWSDAWTDVLTAGSATALDLVDTIPVKLFELIGFGGLVDGSGVSGHDFQGTCARIAMWSATDNSLIADPGSSTVQANFVNGSDETVDPATSRAAYGTPAYDFCHEAGLYNSGLHYGSLAGFTSTENFT